MNTLKLFFVSQDYIDYLRQFDDKVFYNKRITRSYAGVAFMHK